MIKTLSQDNFKEKQLAEQKGGIWAYWQYKEANKAIVVRIYSSAFAVDYYNGIDIEDSESENYDKDAWPKILEIANRFFTTYEFTGAENEE